MNTDGANQAFWIVQFFITFTCMIICSLLFIAVPEMRWTTVVLYVVLMSFSTGYNWILYRMFRRK